MLNKKQQQYLAAMEIQVWKSKPSVLNSISINNDVKEWDSIRQQVITCKACELHKMRKNTVFGIGSTNAKLLFVGEAPGATEDQQGKPFVGRAGMLLDSMLYAIGLQREDVFIANILKCRPPNNRDPSLQEVQCCTPYLNKQIALLEPKLIVALGRISAHFLLDTNLSLGNLRGRVYKYGENAIPLLVTFHPAYLLRSPREKARAYVDLLKISELLSNI